jgi:preprotein translocase subunit SecY
MQKIKRNKNTYGIQSRVILTFLLIILSRFGTFIPVPGVDHDAFYQSISNNPIVSFLNIFLNYMIKIVIKLLVSTIKISILITI